MKARAVTDANFLRRISTAVQRLKILMDLHTRGGRTSRAGRDLTALEYRVEKMLRAAQLAAIKQAIGPTSQGPQ